MATNPTPEDQLRAIPGRHAQPDPKTLATLPKGGANLIYMGHAEVTLALIDADPMWTWEPVLFDDTTGGPLIATQGNRLVMWGRVTVCGKPMLAVGTCEARKADPEKELIGDLLRNAAMRFGIGTKLWSKATDADPVGSGPSGGYTSNARKQSSRDEAAAQQLFDDCKNASDAVKDELRALAEQQGRRIGITSFLESPDFAELVRNALNNKETA
jgi:hypothetical protein